MAFCGWMDLPQAGVSRLRATGIITEKSTSTVLRFGEREFNVGVVARRFPNGGSWSFFVCPGCARWCRTLRVYEGKLACRSCLKARGLLYQVEAISTPERTAYTLRKRLTRPPETIKFKARHEAAIRRSLIVDRQYLVTKAEEVLKCPRR